MGIRIETAAAGMRMYPKDAIQTMARIATLVSGISLRIMNATAIETTKSATGTGMTIMMKKITTKSATGTVMIIKKIATATAMITTKTATAMRTTATAIGITKKTTTETAIIMEKIGMMGAT
jgi:hypothetical protein